MLCHVPKLKEKEEQNEDDSDDGEQGLEGDSNDEEDEGGSDEDSDKDSDDNDEDIPDIGEEPGKAKQEVENPLFEESGESNDSDSDDFNDSDDSDDDSDDDDKKGEKSKGFEGEDDLIATLKAAREKKVRDSPADIRLKESGTDISFHPGQNLLTVGNIQGEISVFRVENEENTALKKLKIHKGGVRCVEYSLDGGTIITGGKDKTIKVLDSETWSLVFKDPLSTPSPLYTLAPLEHGAVSGDEDGTVKIWDFRTKKSVLTSKRFDEFVSSFHVQEERKLIIAASGEGTIQSWDLRMNKADTQSEVYSSELNCLGSVREGTKLVVGSGEGTLFIFNQGSYGYHSDQYPGHPDSINSLLSVTDNVVLTGCEDGSIRAVHLFPHRFIGNVGQHEGDMPIEKMDINGSGEIVASIGHDNRVKFWNIGYLEKMEYEKKSKPVLQKNLGPKKRKLAEAVAREGEHQLPSSGRINKRDFFKGFAE